MLNFSQKQVVLGLKAETADYLQSQKKRYRLTRNEREQRIFESHFQNNAMNPLGVVSIAPLHREEEYQNIIEAESAKVQAIHQTLRYGTTQSHTLVVFENSNHRTQKSEKC